jgi:hypothetical protein
MYTKMDLWLHCSISKNVNKRMFPWDVPFVHESVLVTHTVRSINYFHILISLVQGALLILSKLLKKHV